MSGFTIITFIIAVFFMIISLIFTLLKGKACILISGYNLKTKEERKNYDEERLSKDSSIFYFICGGIFVVGCIGCILISNYCFWVTIIVFLIYSLRKASFNDKDYDKFKKISRS